MLHLTLLSLLASLFAVGASADGASPSVEPAAAASTAAPGTESDMPYGIPADPAERLERFKELAAAQASQTVSGKTLYASPAGGGTDCTLGSPCRVEVAVARGAGGDRVLLGSGSYPKLRLVKTGGLASADAPLVIRPDADADVSVAGVDLHAPGVALQDLTVTEVLYVRPTAVGTALERLHVDGSGIFLRADGSRIVDSLIENGSGLDGIQVKDGTGMLIEGNTVRRFDQSVGKLHADCLQLFDVHDVVVRGNTLSDCHSSSIIFSPGGGTGTSNVLVESNFVAGCVTAPASVCKGGKALDLREPTATDVVVRNNTFMGTVQVAANPEFVVDRNYVSYLSRCDSALTNSVVKSWNTGLCRQPAALGRDGNRQGSVTFVDPQAMDLRVAPADRASVQVQPVASPGLPTTRLDIDGQPFSAGTVGADEPLAVSDVLSTARPR